MNLFVTGGAGFIGSNFIHYWLKHYPDDFITNLDALTYAGNLENLAEIQNNSHYRFVRGDITKPEDIEAALDKAEIIVHFAAESHVDRSILGPEAFVETNVKGTFYLLEAARKHKLRFHHISTDEVFGSLNLGTTDKFTLATPYDPSSPYSASKAASDHLVRAYQKTYGLPITITNCSNNFGPFQFPEKLISLTITNILENKKIPIYGQGNQIRDWLYVEDHCKAIDLVIHRGVIGKTYLVGGQTEMTTNLDVVKLILKLMDKDESQIEYVTDRPGHDVRYTIDWSETNKELGYQPECSFEDYLQQTISWYQGNTEWWQRVKTGAYQDYYQKQYGKR